MWTFLGWKVVEMPAPKDFNSFKLSCYGNFTVYLFPNVGTGRIFCISIFGILFCI
jgi:hypothetical protein